MVTKFLKSSGGLIIAAGAVVVVGLAIWFVPTHMPFAKTILETRTENDATVTRFSDGTQEILAPGAGYAAAIPTGWYIESLAQSGATVYPNYAPEGSSTPRCKIELYVSLNASNTPLEEWVEHALREDPTVAIRQTSIEAMTVGGIPAIRWSGAADDVPMINTYVSAGTRIYEIVPSSFSTGSLSVAPCMDDLDTFIGSLKFQS